MVSIVICRSGMSIWDSSRRCLPRVAKDDDLSVSSECLNGFRNNETTMVVWPASGSVTTSELGEGMGGATYLEEDLLAVRGRHAGQWR